jgi:magnesium-transporting ATPase (P-type)
VLSGSYIAGLVQDCGPAILGNEQQDSFDNSGRDGSAHRDLYSDGDRRFAWGETACCTNLAVLVISTLSPFLFLLPLIATYRMDFSGAAKRPYSANAVSTTKYSLLTWLPRSIFAQFRRVANVYFLVISILMIIGTYAPQLFETPLAYESTVFVLIFVLMVTSVKEGYEDLQRAKSDRYENTKEVTVVTFNADGSTEEKNMASSEVSQ